MTENRTKFIPKYQVLLFFMINILFLWAYNFRSQLIFKRNSYISFRSPATKVSIIFIISLIFVQYVALAPANITLDNMSGITGNLLAPIDNLTLAESSEQNTTTSTSENNTTTQTSDPNITSADPPEQNNTETNISIENITYIIPNITNTSLNISPPEIINLTDTTAQPQVRIIDIIFPKIVKIAQEFNITSVITSLYSKSTITAILSIPDNFIAQDNLSRQMSIDINNTQTIVWTINPTTCGNYSYSIIALSNDTNDSREGNITVECGIQPSISLRASVITAGETKTLEIRGRVFDLNTDKNIPANVTAEVAEDEGDIIFISTKYTEGPFQFDFTMPKNAQGTYNVEVSAYTGYGPAFNSSTFYVQKAASKNIIILSTEKEIYFPNESVNITIEILSQDQISIADAVLDVSVMTPDGYVSYYHTLDSSVEDNGDGTYTFTYHTDNSGQYTILASLLLPDYSVDTTSEKDFEVIEAIKTKTNNIQLMAEELEIIQGVAEVGKPVKWYKTIRVKNTEDYEIVDVVIDAGIPLLSQNVIVKDKDEKKNVKSVSSSSSQKIKANTGKWKETKIKPNEIKEYVVEYETPAPVMILGEVPEDELPPNTNFYGTIRIHHDDENDTLHYENVTVRLPYPERYDNLLKNGFIDLMWLNGTEKFFDGPTSIMDDPRFNVTFEDTDGNGIDDTIVFTVPKLSGSDYGLPGYSCLETKESPSWSCAGTKTSAVSCPYTWTPSYHCLATGIDCQITNITVRYRGILLTEGPQDQMSYLSVKPTTGSNWYYPVYSECVFDDPEYDSGSQTLGMFTKCSHLYNTSDVTGYTGNTCNLTAKDFNTTSYNVTVYSSKLTLTDIFDVNYTWCWEEAKPILGTPLIKSESAASWGITTTGGWGEKFYFNISVNDPQGDEVNLTLWWNESFGVGREHTYLNETICTSCTPESNQTIDYQGFFCNTTVSDIDTDVYFRINASDNSTGSYNNSWGDRNVAPTAAELKSSDSPIYISKYGDNGSLDVAYITINGTGYLNREMVNDTDHWCKSYFTLGQNYWKGGVLSGADCFKENITEPGPSSAIPFMLYGDLEPTITAPVGLINYSITETIPFQGTLSDDCSAAITNENTEVYFKMMQDGSEVANCNASYAGGFWSCSISTNFADFTKGYYNVTRRVYI